RWRRCVHFSNAKRFQTDKQPDGIGGTNHVTVAQSPSAAQGEQARSKCMSPILRRYATNSRKSDDSCGIRCETFANNHSMFVSNLLCWSQSNIAVLEGQQVRIDVSSMHRSSPRFHFSRIIGKRSEKFLVTENSGTFASSALRNFRYESGLK